MVKTLFEYIIEASLIGTFWILLLLIFRKKVLSKYSANFNYYICIVIILKMVLPLKISIYVPKNVLMVKDNVIPSGIYDNMAKISHVISIIPYLYFITSTIIFLFIILCNKKFNSSIKKTSRNIYNVKIMRIYSKSKNEMGIKRNIPLKFCSSISTPFIIGIVKPTIILPERTYEDEDLKWIIKHELIHFKRKDWIYKLLSILVISLHFFNPLIYKLKNILNEDCELSCDEKLLKSLGIDERKNYALTLINSMKFNNQFKLSNSLISPFNDDKNIMNRRIESMLNLKSKKKGIITGALLLVISGASLFSVNVFADTPEEHINDDMNKVKQELQDNLEQGAKEGDLKILNKDGTKVYYKTIQASSEISPEAYK
ncbi:M56 family metallopeptidase [Clostridium estertheticum]|uniref:M56 family metallopeptidase n=1 Tax=Clostridium estertheticum TaxID=238834 RepID=UPI0013EE7075|nr:M56 family metallopeptidase [Clostridium estertheticum]MBZ9609102.1 M56 family metallopeptidase [Clostridium estertheticum]